MYTPMRLVDHSFDAKTNSPRVLGGGKLGGSSSYLSLRIVSFCNLFVYMYRRSSYEGRRLLSCPVVYMRFGKFINNYKSCKINI